MEARHPPLGPTTLFNLPPELAEHPQYEVLRELGRGGMGIVYLAKNKLMDRLEVLKVVNKTLLDRPGAVERFLREIRSAAKLNHPNVVAAYSALQMGELLAFAMEYVEGDDLAQVVKSRGPLPVVHACHYVQQAAIGLQHAFEKGMVHRDIKPQNLILAREGKKHIVKVLDFGLAKATREKRLEATGLTNDGTTRLVDAALTGAGQMLGTPDYIAPEQTLDAAQADIRADIYSLGCTLHFLLSGRPPFAGKNLVEVLQAHHGSEARPLNLVRADVSEALASVVRKMMAKEPSQRYQTPAEVVQALSAAVKPAAKGVAPKSSPDAREPAAERKSDEEMRLLRAKTIVPPAGAVLATMIEGSAIIARVRKPAGAKGSRKWLAVPLAIVLLLAGLAAFLLVFALSKDSPSSAKRAEPSIDKDRVKQTRKAEPRLDKDRMKEPSRKVVVSNSIGMKFAWCPPGTFQMGSPLGEEKRGSDETPHKVTLTKGFYLGTHEVTQAQWRAVMGNNPSHFKGDNLPVETVSWMDCQVFCTELGQRDGKRYRLPTEAEWEYACRAGTTTPFSFGETLSTDQANYNGNFTYGRGEEGVYRQKTTAVGSFPPNAWGLFDMHGNVWEWCQDGYGPYPEEDLIDQQSSNNENARVLRGGSWGHSAENCRAAYRGRHAPAARNIGCGLRVCFRLD